MTIQELIAHYCCSPQLISFSSSIAELTRYKLGGVVGSFFSLLLLHNRQVTQRNQIVILEDEEQAKTVYSDLDSLSTENILFFPSSSKESYMFEKTDNSNVLFRTEVLNKIKNNRASFILILIQMLFLKRL